MKALVIGINLGDCGSTGNMMIHGLQYASLGADFDYLIMTPKQVDGVPNNPFAESKIGIFERLFCHYLIKWTWFVDGDYFLSRSRFVIQTIKQQIKTGRKVVVHLHNIHHSTLNVPYLLKHLSKMDIPVLYTLHDCWSFTGGCYHYEEAKCEGFRRGCRKCPKGFKWSHLRWLRKTKPLLRAKNFILMPCSEWLSTELDSSALACVPRQVVYGETSLVPMPHDPSLRIKHGFSMKDHLLVSVTKGVPNLLKLADVLPNDYKLIIVGRDAETGGRSNVIAPGFVDHETFAEYLAMSDCFISCTPEETLGLVIPEAQMCGLPVVGFGHGGSPEAITKKTGIMVGIDDNIVELLNAIIHVVEDKPFSTRDIVENGLRFAKYEYGKRMLPHYLSLIQ